VDRRVTSWIAGLWVCQRLTTNDDVRGEREERDKREDSVLCSYKIDVASRERLSYARARRTNNKSN